MGGHLGSVLAPPRDGRQILRPGDRRRRPDTSIATRRARRESVGAGDDRVDAVRVRCRRAARRPRATRQRTEMPSSSRRRSPVGPSAAHGIRAAPWRACSMASSIVRTGLVSRSRSAVAWRSSSACSRCEDRRHRSRQPVERVRRLHAAGAQGDGDLPDGDVARAELDPHRHAAQLPVDDAPADRDVGVRIQLGADPGAREILDQARGRARPRPRPPAPPARRPGRARRAAAAAARGRRRGP